MNIAIVHKNVAVAAAMKKVISSREASATFVHVTKMSDAPAGSVLATIGLPSFVSGSNAVSIISLNTKIARDDKERTAQREAIWGESTTEEKALAEFSGCEAYTITPARAKQEMRNNFLQHRLAVAEAVSPEDEAQAKAALQQFLIQSLGL